jgi:hypothetical protein
MSARTASSRRVVVHEQVDRGAFLDVRAGNRAELVVEFGQDRAGQMPGEVLGARPGVEHRDVAPVLEDRDARGLDARR